MLTSLRFRIRSRSDTAVGQIRTLIEGDFEGSPFGTTTSFRLRHAWGEWDLNTEPDTRRWPVLVNVLPLRW